MARNLGEIPTLHHQSLRLNNKESMREIKFRAWDIVSKKFVELWESKYYELFYNTPDSKPYNLMQFTGLKDKNGKEIYEGDIVKTKWQSKAEMVWIDKESCFGLRTIDEIVKDEIMYGFKDEEMEVIGNIYENPELLESK